MSEPLSGDYLEGMRAHVDNGGMLNHRNAVDLLAELERLRALVYASPPTDPFAGDGYTWKQQAEKAESALASAEAAALERAAKVADELAQAYRRQESEAKNVELCETASRLGSAAVGCERTATGIRNLIPPGHSPAPAGEAEACTHCHGTGETYASHDLLARSPRDQAEYDAQLRAAGKFKCAMCGGTGKRAAIASSLAQKEPQQ